MNNYEIVRLCDMWQDGHAFQQDVWILIDNAIETMTEKYAAYNFENHIFSLYNFLKIFYLYFRKNIMNIDNKQEKRIWCDQFVIKMLDSMPSLYVTSKLLTQKFLEKISPEMGTKIMRESKTGLNTSDFNFDMENNKFGSIGKNTGVDSTNDISSLLTNIINWAYPSFIGVWLQSFRQFLFITTFEGGV